MCGIGAILDPAGTTGPEGAQRIVEALRHRGPDGDAIRRIGPVALAHTRLAIIDVQGGDQPLDSEDGQITAIVNGEIYNHVELRTALEQRGHRFATRSDSEVVVHAYEEHGLDCVRRLNGIFAFALWDQRRRRLVAARDQFGVKPLYWWSDGGRVALASEIGALLAAGLTRPEVDRVALDHYLACRFVPSPRTLFEGIAKLPPASTLVADEGAKPRVESWREPPGAHFESMAEDELATQLAERFADAVERQMMSDVPYGAFLSGGVDSAAVVAAMARRSAAPPATFTIGFPGHGAALDEREYAAESARLIGTEHRDTAMTETDFLAELARCIPRLEEPCGIPSAPALLQLSRFAAESVKVVLAGQGADEPHGGYGRHQAAALLRHARLVPAVAATPAAALARALPRAARARRAAHLLGGRGDAERLLRLVEITDEPVQAALLRRDRAGRDGSGRAAGASGEQAQAERLATARDVLADVAGRDLLEQALYLDTRMFLPDGILLCNDKMSMGASLELRVPFLDLELMRFVERIPARVRVRPRAGKRLHRRAMELLLPAGLADRPKHGFSTPYDDWLRRSLGQEVERRYGARSALAELIEPAAVARLVDEHARGRADHKSILYCLLELSEWHAAFVEERQPMAEAAGA
ncbi:MAG TPA: asparagine synthase (glutamine-hydrolyzing) [Thermoleophilaceae bacterium]